MPQMTKNSTEHEMGCGPIGRAFLKRSFWLRKSSVHSLPMETTGGNKTLKVPSSGCSAHNSHKLPIHHPKEQRSKSETVLPVSDFSMVTEDQKHGRRHGLVPPRSLNSRQNDQDRRASDPTRNSTSSSLSLAKLRSDPRCDSRDLGRTLAVKHQETHDRKSLAMPLGQLGNLRRVGSGNIIGNNNCNAATDCLYRKTQEVNSNHSTPRPPRNECVKRGGSGIMGNIVRQGSSEFRLRQGLETRMDHEGLKNLGNEKYKQGRFEEALELYDRAISLDSSKATYRCNKSAALIGLSRLAEAVSECKEALKLDPFYQRAHHRLATLYVRMGEAEKALHHFKESGHYTEFKDIDQSQTLQNHLKRCTEARKLKDWNCLLKETERAVSSGADSAPQVYALQAEALLRLHRHQDSYTTYIKKPNFSIDFCTKLFGLDATCHFLMIGAQVYMAAGRFDDATAVAQEAARIDPSNKEAIMVVRSVKAVASARLKGNMLFKASRFSEAFGAYSEGLEREAWNAILLSNRAACRSKLGQFEKAVEDCTAALCVLPNYSKARLRRADCNAKLGRWEASIQDYEMLIRESPADEEVGRALFEAQVQLKKQHGEDTKNLTFGSNLVLICSNERFRHFVTSPGMSVVLFCKKANHKQVWKLMEQVCKRFPSVNFLKVEVEDHPYLAKSEDVTLLPCFKIYKNGSRVQEVPGNNPHLLELSVKLYST